MWSMADINPGTKHRGTREQMVHSQVGARLLGDGGELVWITARNRDGDEFEVFEIPRDAKSAVWQLEFNGCTVIKTERRGERSL